MTRIENTDSSELICRTGTVIRAEKGAVWVEVERESSCEACGSKGHCGAIFSAEHLLEIKTDLDIPPGKRVEIGMRPGAILSASVLLFIVPAVAFLSGIILGYWLADSYQWGNQQWYGFGFGLVTFLISYLVIKLISPRLEASGSYEPVLTRILDEQA